MDLLGITDRNLFGGVGGIGKPKKPSAAERSQMRALAKLGGKFTAKVDPNKPINYGEVKSTCQKVVEESKRKARRLEQKRERDRDGPSAEAEKRAKKAKTFGISKEELERIRNAKSINKSAADIEEYRQAHAVMDVLVREEELEEQRSTVTEVKVGITKCSVASCPMYGKWVQGKNALCVKWGHRLAFKKGRKYFFKCTKCNRRHETINKKHYKGTCKGCGGRDIVATSAFKSKHRMPKGETLKTHTAESWLGKC